MSRSEKVTPFRLFVASLEATLFPQLAHNTSAGRQLLHHSASRKKKKQSFMVVGRRVPLGSLSHAGKKSPYNLRENHPVVQVLEMTVADSCFAAFSFSGILKRRKGILGGWMKKRIVLLARNIWSICDSNDSC